MVSTSLFSSLLCLSVWFCLGSPSALPVHLLNSLSSSLSLSPSLSLSFSLFCLFSAPSSSISSSIYIYLPLGQPFRLLFYHALAFCLSLPPPVLFYLHLQSLSLSLSLPFCKVYTCLVFPSHFSAHPLDWGERVRASDSEWVREEGREGGCCLSVALHLFTDSETPILTKPTLLSKCYYHYC